jgi:hypothetical protein
VKRTVRNSTVLAIFGLALLAASSGCSDEPTEGFNGFGNNGNSAAGTGTSSGGSSAGTFASTAGTSPSTSGSSNVGVAGTSFSTSGASSTAGSPGTAGAGAGGAGTAGAGGAGTAGSAGAGTAGTGGTAGGCTPPTGVHTGTAFTRTCFSITASHCANTAENKDPPANALDGDTMTRWSTGGAMDTARKYTFTVDLGAPVMVSGIMAATKAGSGDAPPEVEVGVSMSAAGPFTPVACGAVATDIDFGFAATNAQFVRLTQVGTKTPNWWSITELNVYGTGTTCGGGGTGTHVCTVNVQ